MRQLRVRDGEVFRRVRYGPRRAQTPCNPCCTTQTWYILAVPCGIPSGVGGPCQPLPRQYVWVCVDAKLSDTGQTIRESLGPTESCVTFLYGGWCYSVCYTPPSDDGFTTFDPPRIPGSLPVVECGDTIEVVARRPYNPATPGYNAADCGTTACPTGVNYVEATRCSGGYPDPRVFVCSGQVRRAIVTGQTGECLCIKPGPGIDAAFIPPGSRIFNSVAYPEDNPGVVNLTTTILAEFEQCCECLPGCVVAPLRWATNTHKCCCGEGRVIAYATSWSVTRTQDNGNSQTITGNGTSGTPNATTGGLPVRYTFTSNVVGQPPAVSVVDTELPDPGFECGFPYLFGYPGGTGGSFPPPSWCEYGPATLPCHQDGTGGYLGYNLVGRFGWPTILPNLGPGGQDAQQGTLVGVCNASCTSLAAELIGTLRNDETGETYEARYNINLTYNVVVPEACRGNCVETAQVAPGVKPKPITEGCSSCGQDRLTALESIL